MLSRVAELSGVPLTDAAKRLLSATQQQQQQQQPSASTTPPSLSDPAPAGDDLAQLHDVAAEAAVPPAAPAAAQLRTLFQLWDRQGDGYISFTELCHGLSKMQKPIKHKKVCESMQQGRLGAGLVWHSLGIGCILLSASATCHSWCCQSSPPALAPCNPLTLDYL
jgi:hypothetical protein